ncbi:hypothetical protein [Lacticaseibacillus daqingensis]|uniref:hypothetical protein n=1 Tax=Lacticaseibacillus daqingensis TaxID=2486014 RepID=UPI000F7A351C|nr:hypothetical protein [Lacticaseibacillus daqingensis]
MLILLIAMLAIFWFAHLWLNKQIISAVQARQHEMLPKQIAQAQRMFKRQWYRAHPVWRWIRRLAIGINGVALVALIGQMLSRASWVVLPVAQRPLAILTVAGFIIAGLGLAVVMWHYDQMLLATAQTDLYTPPRLLVRANWWLLVVCQCVLVGTAGVTMQTPS